MLRGAHVGVVRLVLVAALVAARPVAAEPLCVAIDTTRDNLSESDRAAVRIAILDALQSEGVQVDPQGRTCSEIVTAYSIKLGNPVKTTITVGSKTVTGDASNLEEVDLLVRQLVRSLVTGRSMATGSGVTDRTNVLREQTAPRRVDALRERLWEPVVAIGGGMLQLPGFEDRARHRQYNAIAIEVREWGFLSSRQTAMELYGRVLLHDYAAIETAKDYYDEASDDDGRPSHRETGRGAALVFSPFAVANYELGMGFVAFAGETAPRPFVRIGATASLLLRISDPNHRVDLGLGGYVGVGFQIATNVSLSVAANVSNPMVHNFMDRGYAYFFTTTAMLEFKGAPKHSELLPGFVNPEPTPTIRRINE